MAGSPDFERQQASCVGSGVAYYQFRKVHKTMKFWDTCTEFTYGLYKDNPEYESRRLVVLDETIRD